MVSITGPARDCSTMRRNPAGARTVADVERIGRSAVDNGPSGAAVRQLVEDLAAIVEDLAAIVEPQTTAQETNR